MSFTRDIYIHLSQKDKIVSNKKAYTSNIPFVGPFLLHSPLLLIGCYLDSSVYETTKLANDEVYFDDCRLISTCEFSLSSSCTIKITFTFPPSSVVSTSWGSGPATETDWSPLFFSSCWPYVVVSMI